MRQRWVELPLRLKKYKILIGILFAVVLLDCATSHFLMGVCGAMEMNSLASSVQSINMWLFHLVSLGATACLVSLALFLRWERLVILLILVEGIAVFVNISKIQIWASLT